MSGFEPLISDVGSNHSAKCTTTTAHCPRINFLPQQSVWSHLPISLQLHSVARRCREQPHRVRRGSAQRRSPRWRTSRRGQTWNGASSCRRKRILRNGATTFVQTRESERQKSERRNAPAFSLQMSRRYSHRGNGLIHQSFPWTYGQSYERFTTGARYNKSWCKVSEN